MTQEIDRLPKTPQQRWLMILRLVISTFLLIALIFIKTHDMAKDISLRWFEPGLLALAFYYLLAIIYYYFPAPNRVAVYHQSTQVAADLALALCLTIITGGGDSPFSFLFLIAIINSAFLGGSRVALIVATISAAIWGALITLQDSGQLAVWLPALKPPASFPGNLAQEINRAGRIIINTGACYLVAFLSGYLSGQLVISRQALVRSQAHVDRLAELNESVIQSIDSGLITMDQSGLILSVNRAGLEIIGLKLSDMVGRPWQIFFPQLEHILPLSPRGRSSFFDAGGLRFEYARLPDSRELILELNV
ncbi:MAG: PAS domain S-box protein, partial [Candidatus Adiutrix sp.]|nr:PAS domain S-box protein [Candidatus Adiutrix sp.]